MLTMKNWVLRAPDKSDRMIGFEGENKSRTLEIHTDDSGDWEYKLDLRFADEQRNILDLIKDGDDLSVLLERSHVSCPGNAEIQVRGIRTVGTEIIEKHSNVLDITILSSINATEAFEDLEPSEFAQLEARLTSLKDAAETARDDAVAAGDGIGTARDEAIAAAEEAKTAAGSIGTAVEDARAAATAAETAQNKAEESASGIDLIGKAAEEAANRAEQSAANAKDSEDAANASAQNAAKSATDAAASAKSASDARDAASQSAETAQTQSASASTSAANAAKSAGAAATSETNAAGSAAAANTAKSAAEAARNAAETATLKSPSIGANGTWMVYDAAQGAYVDTGIRAQGETGAGFKVLDYYASKALLESSVPNPNPGDAYGVGVADPYDIYIYSPSKGWVNNGPLQGMPGDPGANGITPHIGANGNWYIGEVDTGSPSRGAAGVPGVDGAQGVPGVDGVTPTIGANGNWFLGMTDTGKPSRGETGQTGLTGPAGANGVSATHSWNGTVLTVTSASGSSSADLKGEPGEMGLTGPAGVDGSDGITPTIGENGNWYLGTTDTGKPARGPAGIDGATGETGKDGVTPTIGSNGNWFLGATDTGKPSRGPAGVDGATGNDGASAYEQAVSAGYTGTLAQFTADLQNISSKQNKLTGANGKFVGFDSGGNAVPQDVSQHNVVIAAGTDYTACRVRGIALYQDNPPSSLPNGCIVGVYEIV